MSDTPDPRAEEALARPYAGRLMRLPLGYLAPYRGHALAALALMVASSAGQLFGPVATAVAFDLYLAPAVGAGDAGRRSGISAAVADWLASAGREVGPLEGLTAIAGLWAAVLALTFGLLWAQGYVLQRIARSAGDPSVTCATATPSIPRRAA